MPFISIVHHHCLCHSSRKEFQLMSRQLDNLVEEVAALRGVTSSAAALLGNLADQIEHLQNNPAALQALADDIRAQRENLTTAILINDGDPTTNPPTTGGEEPGGEEPGGEEPGGEEPGGEEPGGEEPGGEEP